MNNKKWLEYYIQCLQVVSADKAVAVYSFDFKFLYASELYLRLSGATTEIIGKRFQDSSAPGVELAGELYQISQIVNETGKKAKFILVYPSPIDQIKKCFRFETYRVYNPYNGEPICRVGEIYELNLEAVNQLFNVTNLVSNLNLSDLSNELNSVELSSREQEILFLLLLGKSYKEIASILMKVHKKPYSASTVSSITMRQLLPKFSAHSVRNMLAKVSQSRILTTIPPSLLFIENGIHLLEFTEE
ncbi:helix-turn-helix transcriptional regulator [Aquella oligotrophica]|uniref:HTH luxR-type domain-containing protein n=1 Tax=Aquella oligotrophica TaxID=2067065 RepID=A0A2I7N730_9NEIS|nr:hypothetical protein [Aquella oligotrophica]AUR52273.1 hypothetical protein CUN60_08185 [Aquella oligotrophica]